MSGLAAVALRWIGGFLFSLLFIWFVCTLFLDSIVPPVWDDGLKIYVRKPGITVHWRSEGGADIPVGTMGLDANDAAILESGAPCYVLWGDSFVDALQVPSSDRAVGIINAQNGLPKIVAVGGGGLNVADYYFRIPRLQEKISNIRGNVILLVGMEDVVPGKHVACHSRFLADPWRFEESLCEPSQLALDYAPLLYETRLGFLQSLYSRLKDYDFRFAWGPDAAVARSAPAPEIGNQSYDEAWNYLLTSLKQAGEGDLAFIYVPSIPRPGGNVVHLDDPDASVMKRFKEMCAARGVGFVDLSPEFRDLYVKQGVFPRGFFNSPPGSGHLNAHGHRLVAEALEKLLEGRD